MKIQLTITEMQLIRNALGTAIQQEENILYNLPEGNGSIPRIKDNRDQFSALYVKFMGLLSPRR